MSPVEGEAGRAAGLHLESAAADLVSKPTRRLSMGTNIPPPPTPPTVPNAEPRNPTTVATTTRQLNARSCNPTGGQHAESATITRTHAREKRARSLAAYRPDARRPRGEAEAAIGVTGARLGGGNDEAGEHRGARRPRRHVCEEPPRAAPVEAPVQARGRRHIQSNPNKQKTQKKKTLNHTSAAAAAAENARTKRRGEEREREGERGNGVRPRPRPRRGLYRQGGGKKEGERNRGRCDADEIGAAGEGRGGRRGRERRIRFGIAFLPPPWFGWLAVTAQNNVLENCTTTTSGSG